MLEIIKLNSSEWNQLLDHCVAKDYYHSNEYHILDAGGEPILLKFSFNDLLILLPLIIRKIEGTEFKDATSVYGYAGPIANQSEFSDDEIKEFQSAFLDFCKNANIISVFSRLHPLIDSQELILSKLGIIQPLNKTIAIDLSLSIDEQRACFRKSTKYDINQLRKKGLIVRKAQNESDIDAFIDIYFESMKRVNANQYYFFSRDYFYSFLKSIDSEVLLAEYESKIIAGALFTYYGNIMQYHLAGTSNDYLSLAPMKLILDEARRIGTERNLEYLHLGGGVGGEDDALFRFKSGFSKSVFQFKVWKYIANKEIYQQLISEKFGEKVIESNYFPLYRM